MKKILALALALVMVLALAACGGSKAETAEAPAADAPAAAPAEAPAAPEAPAAEAPAAPEAPAGDASGEPGEASGEPSGNPMPANGEIEITVDGVTGTATFEETDNGDQATKGLSVTWQGQTYTGGIDKGQYTADDAAAQPIFSAIQAAREAMGAGVPSCEPTGEPQA